ncbi:MAG: hypothetical protein ACO3R6_12805, partial [Lutimaribacter sp.]
AMQQDIGKQFTALRRALATLRRQRGVSLGMGGLVVAVMALFALTLGSAIMGGGMVGPLAVLGDGTKAAFGIFVAGAALLCVVAWAVAAVLMLRAKAQSA